MTDEADNSRSLHARVLGRKPVVADLPEKLRYVANASPLDEEDPVWRRVRDNLSVDEWNRIGAARTEEQRREAENAEAAALCRRGDEAALRSMYPGHAAYFDMVRSPPAFEKRPTDAVVVIEIGAGSSVRRAKEALESGMAREALKVQYGGSPNQHAKRFNTERFFMGYYTPEIEARMETPRPDCDRLRTSRYTQAACRRDITVSIVRDWLEARGHRSVRFLVSDQASWPHYQLLIERLLSDVDTCIDTKFDHRLRRNTSFLREMCTLQRGPGVWIDYEAYVATLFRTVDPD